MGNIEQIAGNWGCMHVVSTSSRAWTRHITGTLDYRIYCLSRHRSVGSLRTCSSAIAMPQMRPALCAALAVLVCHGKRAMAEVSLSGPKSTNEWLQELGENKALKCSGCEFVCRHLQVHMCLLAVACASNDACACTAHTCTHTPACNTLMRAHQIIYGTVTALPTPCWLLGSAAERSRARTER